MYYIRNDVLEQAIINLASSGVSEYFKLYLTLKAFGLSWYPPQSVDVNTTNTTEVLYRLFGVRELDTLPEFTGEIKTPFFNPLFNEKFKEDAARSIIQTHCKAIALGNRVVDYPWLTGEQTPDGSWRMSFMGDYPHGLGAGKSGMAHKDGTQVSISTPDFILWYFRYQTWDQLPLFSNLFAQMTQELNFHEAEIVLLFDNQREFLLSSSGVDDVEVYPFTEEPLDERRLAEFIAQRLALQAKGRTVSSVSQFSGRKMASMISTFSTTKVEDNWWRTANIFEEAIEILTQRRSLLLVGPPGTGKTRLAVQLAEKLTSSTKDLHLFQFHAAYDYDTFIEALIPKPTEGGLQFEPIKRRFVKICEEARTQDKAQVVILDEFNRADISKVFGEIFFLIEDVYREVKFAVPLVYNEKDVFWIPPNVYIIATMNDVDRSTFEVDFAVRRRFGELRVEPDPVALASMLREDGCANEELIRIACSLLGQVQSVYPLGHAYFKGLYEKSDLPKVYRRSIRPVIENYLGEFRKDELAEIDKLFRKAHEAATWEQFVESTDDAGDSA